jgi:hypothetical protein
MSDAENDTPPARHGLYGYGRLDVTAPSHNSPQLTPYQPSPSPHLSLKPHHIPLIPPHSTPKHPTMPLIFMYAASAMASRTGKGGLYPHTSALRVEEHSYPRRELGSSSPGRSVVTLGNGRETGNGVKRGGWDILCETDRTLLFW